MARNWNPSLEIRLIRDESEYRAVCAVRQRVFVQEQHVPSALEFDGLDDVSMHVIVNLGQTTIGCARMHSIVGQLKLERIAILKAYRNRGFGSQLMAYMVSYGQAGNAHELVLDAQVDRRSFYEACGFQTRGEPFIEAGIPHIEMYRAIEEQT